MFPESRHSRSGDCFKKIDLAALASRTCVAVMRVGTFAMP